MNTVDAVVIAGNILLIGGALVIVFLFMAFGLSWLIDQSFS